MSHAAALLRAQLQYEPVPLRFGTSGRRGLVADLTQLEVYLNALAELEYLQSLPVGGGGIVRGEEFYFATDLRPSSTGFCPEFGGRGELTQAVARAIADAGMRPVFLGRIPTPALAAFALAQGKGSMMVTGSHIPFDRNGYKTNTSRGELRKSDEEPVQAFVERTRARLYGQPFADSLFDVRGMFKAGHVELPPENPAARERYLRRYLDFFGPNALQGRRLLAYQHSAVGRDLLVELLQQFGAEVIPVGRSETFVPIDTENIGAEQLQAVETLAISAWQEHGPLEAVVSTDGDSDRPLLLAIEPTAAAAGQPPCRVRFFGGDLLGMVVAEFLGADAVVVPVSCNDAIDRGPLCHALEPKTRIGSPFVIDGMEQARAKGRRAICGWEANGGFLTGSDLIRQGRSLTALPTRDALLPLLSVLVSASTQGLSLSALFDRLPKRFSRAALLPNFPRPASQRIVSRLAKADAAAVAGIFRAEDGFATLAKLDCTDGARLSFKNGDVAHVRPSGNADELRIYAVADTQERADAIARLGVAEPDGLLRRLERWDAVERFRNAPALAPLRGGVQAYDWGGFDFIPALLGQPHPSARPCAELWLGAHPGGASTCSLDGVAVPLPELIAHAPRETLGASPEVKTGLPYLFKVLEARQMLSIQAHPTRSQAEAGYDREQALGVPLRAPNRNYKDRNHKPEVHVALTEFWMLHGFRPLEEIAATLTNVPELRGLMPEFGAELLRAGADELARASLLRRLYEHVMTMPQGAVDALLDPLLARLKQGTAPPRTSPDYWALRAAEAFPLPGGHRDRGILSIYLLNLVRLEPGQGTYQPAGCLHAYLEGVNMELMANSDNVLRGGLTPKHVDVPELMRVLDFRSGKPQVLTGQAASTIETVYPTPAPEFELSRVRVAPGTPYSCLAGRGPQILIVLEGAVRASCGGVGRSLRRGEAVFAPDAIGYELTADAPATLYKAALPFRT